LDLEIFTITTAAILCGLAIIHAIFDGSSNRLLMLATLFIYGIFLEFLSIKKKNLELKKVSYKLLKRILFQE